MRKRVAGSQLPATVDMLSRSPIGIPVRPIRVEAAMASVAVEFGGQVSEGCTGMSDVTWQGPSQRFCTGCGAALLPDAVFCVGCGQPASGPEQALGSDDVTRVRRQDPPTRATTGAPWASPTTRGTGLGTKGIVAAVAVGAVIVGGGAIAFGIRQSSNSQQSGTYAAPTLADTPAPTNTDYETQPNEPTATATAVPAGSASAAVDDLYRAWTARDTSEIHQLVTPALYDAFDPAFLDSKKIARVDNYVDTETDTPAGKQVCGTQVFVKRNGAEQSEHRCFIVKSEGSALKIVRSYDFELIEAWH